MENNEIKTTTSVSAELSPEQYAFLTKWQKAHEQELGIEVPIGAMVRKAVDGAMKAQQSKDERPPRPDRPTGRSSERGDFKSGPRKPFGTRPPMGRGGPKFDILGTKNKTRAFNK